MFKSTMFDKMLSGVFFMISFAASFGSCTLMEGEEFHSALKQALHSLLKAHEMCTTQPVEQRLSLPLNGYPDPNAYILPNAIVWEPHRQLAQFLPGDFFCPICNEHGMPVLLKPKEWKDGRLRRLMPRQITGISGRFLLISRVYSCSAGHEINGHDPSVLAMIGSTRRIPFILSHRTGVTRELLDMFVSMVRNGLSFAQIHEIVLDRLHLRHLELDSRFLEDLNSYSARHPIIIVDVFPRFNPMRDCPSRNTISDFFLHYFDLNEDLFVKRMTETSADDWLSCDHTFDITSSVGYERKEDGKWIRHYDSLFCVMNEKGHVVTWQLTQTQGFENVRRNLEQLHRRLANQGKRVKEFYIDNCCHWRKKLQEVFGSELAVKLDLFHALSRISTKISKRHPFYGRCLQDLRLIFRDTTDVGDTRTEKTPDPNTLLKNAELFLKKWANVESSKGKPVLSEEAVNEIRKIQEHMKKGCLSGKCTINTYFSKNYYFGSDCAFTIKLLRLNSLCEGLSQR